MDDAIRPKATLESFAYTLEMEIQLKLRGADFEIRAAGAVISSIERIVQAFAADLEMNLGAVKLGVMSESGVSTLRLRPILNGDEFSKGMTAALVATALWSSMIGIKACVEAAFDSLSTYAPGLARILKREFLEIEKQVRAGQAIELACLIKEAWEYKQGDRQRTRSEEWRIESGQIRQPGDEQPLRAETQSLPGSSQIPLRWPFRPLSFFGPGDPFTPWWEKRKEVKKK